MSRPMPPFQELPKTNPQQARPSPLVARPRAPKREQQPAAKTSYAVLEKPLRHAPLPFSSLESVEDELSLMFETDLPTSSPCLSPGFSSYDEAEATRSRLPVHSLDLVPTIMTRSRGCPVMLTAAVWLDRQMTTPSSGWLDTSSALSRFGQELAARAYLSRADGSGQKYFAFIRDLWAIHEDEDAKVWHTSYIQVDDQADLNDPIGRGFFTGGGPSWPANSNVTVLAKAVDAHGEFWIKSYPSPVMSG